MSTLFIPLHTGVTGGNAKPLIPGIFARPDQPILSHEIITFATLL
ncbi:MAG: hypothetical protein ACP5QA_07545 [Phycisphaerae bacterium]